MARPKIFEHVCKMTLSLTDEHVAMIRFCARRKNTNMSVMIKGMIEKEYQNEKDKEMASAE